ncbi:MAG TPA: 30S ribosomal protein S1 [Pyrinomonadaceae bacterium]|nr:30S ribosomal protein S1 [Pyrinomonadaceae bacterium]
MTNEVISETDESLKNESPVFEQTNTPASGETATDEPTVLAEQSASLTEQPTSAETPVSPPEQPTSSDEDFGSILEKFEQEQTIYHTGDLVEGKVVGISDRGVLVDFGYKSEGIVPVEEFTTATGDVTVKQGDDVEIVIRSINTGDAPPVLSRTDAIGRVAWGEIEKAYNQETPVKGRVLDKTKGGLIVDVLGIEAFLPGSQIDSRPVFNLDSYKGQEIEAKVIKFSRKRNNIVLSRKVLTDEVVNKQKAETLGQIEEGYVIEGTIKNLTEYGAFVDIGGIDGLLHVTDMSWGRLQNPGDQFKVGDHLQVKVLKLDRQKEKISLGFRQLIPDPWSTVMEVYPINSKINGTVSSVTDYGAFIELESGVEGLVHVSEMSWSKRSQNPKRFLKSGDAVEVQVLGIDTNDRRISLGMKQLQANPWETITQRYQIGSKVHGRVRNLTDFGAFVEVEEGVDGLVHVSDITWSKKVKHPKDVLKKDQEVDAVITGIDTAGQRMSLSIKELTPSAWESFVATHRTGDIVRGTVSRFAGFGVFVQLGEELEGLCHISELSDERVNKPEDVVSIGQEMDFKILRIENDVQKIGLSARAVGKEAEPAVDTKMYSTEAKSGMASLGELMNLKRGSATEAEAAEEPRLSKKERKAQKAKDRADETDSGSQTETASGDTDSDSQTNAVSGETDAQSSSAEAASIETSVDETETQAVEDKSSEVTAQEDASEISVETSETVSEDSIASSKNEAADKNPLEAETADSIGTESEKTTVAENVASDDSPTENAPDDKAGNSESNSDAEEKSAKG